MIALHTLPLLRAGHTGRRYIFCATFLQVALTGRYPAHCPAEFGLSSPPSLAYASFGEAIILPTAAACQRAVTRRERAAAVGRKPNSVRLRSRPYGLEQSRDDHSSSPAIAGGIKQPTRKLRTGRPSMLPYLALLRAGFCLPPVLPRARCALTAPFHHYRPSPLRASARQVSRPAVGCMFSVPLSFRLP